MVWLSVLDRLESALQKDMYEFDWSIIIATISFTFQIFYKLYDNFYFILFFIFYLFLSDCSSPRKGLMNAYKDLSDHIIKSWSWDDSWKILHSFLTCVESLHFLDFNQYVKGND